jgi:hypothetical protein
MLPSSSVAPAPSLRAAAEEASAAVQRRARLGLLGVAAIYVAVHALGAGLDRPINWDEAVHFTQVLPGQPAVFMEPHRTRGLSLLVAPIAWLDPSMAVFRGYLLVLGASGLFAAFATWIRTVGYAAVLAAILYASYWVTVFYSVELLPNHAAALLSVGVAGYVTGRREALGRRELAVAALAMLVFTLVRPPDAVLLGIGLSVAFVVLRDRPGLRALPALAAGGTVAMVSWWIEGAVRFGFPPWVTVRSAGEYSVSGERINQLPLYLRALEDRLRCAGGCQADYLAAGGGWELPPVRTTAFLLVALALSVLALAWAPGRRRATVTVLSAAVAFVPFYAYSGGAMNLRYLLPFFALALLLPSIGVFAVRDRFAGRTPPGRQRLIEALAIGLLVLLCAWQVGAGLARLEEPGTRHRAADLGLALAEVVEGDACAVAADVNYPQIQYWSGCYATVIARGNTGELQPALGEPGSYVDLHARAEAGDRIFALTRRSRLEGSPAEGWTSHPLPAAWADRFVLLERPPDVEVPPPPCPDDPTVVLVRVMSRDC